MGLNMDQDDTKIESPGAKLGGRKNGQGWGNKEIKKRCARKI